MRGLTFFVFGMIRFIRIPSSMLQFFQLHFIIILQIFVKFTDDAFNQGNLTFVKICQSHIVINRGRKFDQRFAKIKE